MRRPRLPKRRRVIRLGDLRALRGHRYVVDGEMYVLNSWSLDMDGCLRLDLVTESSFIRRNEIREQRRWLVDLMRRQRAKEPANG